MVSFKTGDRVISTYPDDPPGKLGTIVKAYFRKNRHGEYLHKIKWDKTYKSKATVYANSFIRKITPLEETLI
jgi:hypothetical protein